jgi:fluoride exporter
VLRVVYVAAGGALGATARYLLSTWIAGRAGPDFPWGTFVINLSGSFLIGLVLGLVEAGSLSSDARLFLAVGVLGGYTTFSTFTYESLGLIAEGNLAAFLFNSLGQFTSGLVAVYLGLVLSRALGGVR